MKPIINYYSSGRIIIAVRSTFVGHFSALLYLAGKSRGQFFELNLWLGCGLYSSI